MRFVCRCADVVVLRGQLRQAYLHCWRALPSPYDVSGKGAGVYGESFVVTARAILRKHGAAEGSTVVDLGCGRGNVVVAAASLGANGRGVDVEAAHVDAVRDALAVVGASVDVGDARDVEFAGVTHVWCAWATWPAELRRAVSTKMHGLPSGAVVVGVVHGVDDEEFDVVERARAAFSWGLADVVVSRRR